MKTKINGYVIEGTPEEFKQLIGYNKKPVATRTYTNKSRKNQRWTDHEVHTLKEMRAEGKSFKHIARVIKRPLGSVYQKHHQLTR